MDSEERSHPATSRQPPAAEAAASSPPVHAASVPPVDLARPAGLEPVGLHDLVRELVARLDGASPSRETIRVLAELAGRLGPLLDTPDNRFSPAYLQELLGTYLFWLPSARDPAGEVFLELGAGAEAPLQAAAAMFALGASQAFALELTPPLQPRAQARSLAQTLFALAVCPARFPKLDLAAFRAVLLERMRHFDLAALDAGRLVLPDGVTLLTAPAERTGLPAASVHRVASTSFLEHADDPDAVVAEIARVTTPGGVSVHNIDATDHGAYWGIGCGPVDFLCEQPDATSVRGCNRLRIPQFVRLFESRGFRLVRRSDYRHHEWTDEQRRALVPPFAAMPLDDLRPLQSVLVFRRV